MSRSLSSQSSTSGRGDPALPLSANVENLADLLENSARRHAAKIAVVAPDGSSLTCRELDDRANRVAQFLRSRGVEAGDRVGICLPKGLASVAVLFGAMKARAAYVPVDWNGPAARNRTILQDCGVAALFLGERRADVFDGWPVETLPRTIVRVESAECSEGGEGGESASNLQWPDSAISFADAVTHAPASDGSDEHGSTARRRDDLAYVLYTSGSTGVPKGVAITHGNALSFVAWCAELLQPNESDRFSSHAPFHFDLSILDLYVAIEHGATLFLIGEDDAKNPKALVRFAARQRLTIWYSTPSVLATMVEFGGLDACLDLSSLRHVCFAGEVFPVQSLRRLTQWLPRASYWNLYGPTETNVCTFARIPLPVPDDRVQPFPIGALCRHCEGVVLDDELDEVARGDEGTLWIAGPSVFRGYWRRPDLDAKVFLERDGKRWYCTGDVVRVDRDDPNGGLVYVGRKDRMVKRRGFRVELGEIEAALHRHPQVREVAVVALPDAESGVAIHAHVSGRAGEKLSLVELKRFCTANLPASMSPDRFVFHDALPRTSTDKVDYQALSA